jgi:hypothetical protein
MRSFEGGVPYYIYRLLSGLTHAGLSTSRVYAPIEERYGPRFLNQPENPVSEAMANAPVLDVAVRCAQASLVFQREVNDPDLDTRMTRWCNDMGVALDLPTSSARKDTR